MTVFRTGPNVLAKCFWRYCYDTSPEDSYPPANVPTICILRLSPDEFTIEVCTVLVDLYTQQKSWVRHLSDYHIQPYAWLDVLESEINSDLLVQIRAAYGAIPTVLTDDSANSLIQNHRSIAL